KDTENNQINNKKKTQNLHDKKPNKQNYRGQIVDVSASVYTVQLTGTSDKLDSFIQSIGTASILETVRSGVTGIARGDKVLSI
ncbi:hypothetical protein ACIQVE_29285, partial [Pseudomonas sp. NPDC098747]